jgi:hypothetical protein
MENPEIVNEQPKKRTGLIILIILFSLFMIYYTIMALLSPYRKVADIKNEFLNKLDMKNKVDERIYSDSLYLKLLKEKAYLQSRVLMAETDSIYLTINLPDSSMNLEINGVAVHKAKIGNMRMSKILGKGNDYIISSMLSLPFTISNDISSIEKEPLLIQMAPKDTSEYQPDIVPDTADYEPVNYILETDNGVRIYVYQEDKLNPGDRLHVFKFDMHDKIRNFIGSLKSIMVLKIPDYKPYIKLRIPREDAKIIYRAIPVHGQIAIYR